MNYYSTETFQRRGQCEIVDVTTFVSVAIALILGIAGTTIGSIALYDTMNNEGVNHTLQIKLQNEVRTVSHGLLLNSWCQSTTLKTAMSACVKVENLLTEMIYEATVNDDYRLSPNFYTRRTELGFEIQLVTFEEIDLPGRSIMTQMCGGTTSSFGVKRVKASSFDMCIHPSQEAARMVFPSESDMSIQIAIFLIPSDQTDDGNDGLFQAVRRLFPNGLIVKILQVPSSSANTFMLK